MTLDNRPCDAGNVTMTETQLIALRMIADPEHAGWAWKEVEVALCLSEDEDADGEDYCSVVYSCWVYANLAALIAAGDDAKLAAFIEEVDPERLIRDREMETP